MRVSRREAGEEQAGGEMGMRRWCVVGGREKSRIVLFLKNNPLASSTLHFFPPELAAAIY